MTKATIYTSYCQWPISWSRLQDGWLIRFFALTIIVDTGGEARHA